MTIIAKVRTFIISPWQPCNPKRVFDLGSLVASVFKENINRVFSLSTSTVTAPTQAAQCIYVTDPGLYETFVWEHMA